MTLQTFRLRLALCDALTSPYMKERVGSEWSDEVIKATEPLRLAILKVSDEDIQDNWREWESAILGKEPPKLRPIENDPMQAFINATF